MGEIFQSNNAVSKMTQVQIIGCSFFLKEKIYLYIHEIVCVSVSVQGKLACGSKNTAGQIMHWLKESVLSEPYLQKTRARRLDGEKRVEKY